MIKNKKKENKRLQKRIKSGTTNKSKVSTKKTTSFLIKPKSLKNNSLNYIKKHKEKEKEKDKLLQIAIDKGK